MSTAKPRAAFCCFLVRAADGLVGVLGGVGMNPAGGALGVRAPDINLLRVDFPDPFLPNRAILLLAVMLRVTS